MEETAKQEVSYNASAIVNIFNNALTNEATRKIIRAKGIYSPGRGQNYNGVYYDQLKDEATDACITLIVPAIIRTRLEKNKTIECYGYITKKVQMNGAKIELQLNLTELLAQQESRYTEDDLQAFKIIQSKANNGYRDVDSFLKTKIINNEPIRIIILHGTSGIIQHDIRHQLEEAISFYDFDFKGISLGSETSIINALQEHHEIADILVISRGGGENLQIFNKPAIAEAALSLSAHFITAIGHEQDSSLLQKVADKAFITPTALGQYFNEIYNRTMEELQNSKARLVEDITKQLQANYEHQIKNLNDRIKAKEEAHLQSGKNRDEHYNREINLMREQAAQLHSHYQNRLAELHRHYDDKLRSAGQPNNYTALYWVLIITAVIIGIMIGKGCR